MHSQRPVLITDRLLPSAVSVLQRISTDGEAEAECKIDELLRFVNKLCVQFPLLTR